LKVLTTGVLPVKAHDIHDNHRLLSYHDNHRLLSYSNNDIYDTIICQYYCTSLFRLVEDAIEQFRHVNALTCELLVSFITFMLLSGLIYTPQDFWLLKRISEIYIQRVKTFVIKFYTTTFPNQVCGLMIAFPKQLKINCNS